MCIFRGLGHSFPISLSAFWMIFSVSSRDALSASAMAFAPALANEIALACLIPRALPEMKMFFFSVAVGFANRIYGGIRVIV